MTTERPPASSEQLSNRRLMYETFVTAMRQVSDTHSDAHYVRGITPEGTRFAVHDYFYFDHIDGVGSTLLEGPQKRQQILGNRRPIIAIDGYDPHPDGRRRSYIMVYPEDMRPERPIGAPLNDLLPKDWPAGEPFIYQMVSSGNGRSAEYHRIEEPFLEPDLATIYNTVVTTLNL